MKKTLICIVFLFTILSFSLSAQNAWFGEWQSEPLVEGTEKVIIEFNFSNDTTMMMSLITYNNVVGAGSCISRMSISGTYEKYGPLFDVNLDQESIDVSVLKYLTHQGKRLYKGLFLHEIQSRAESIFSNIDEILMVLVTHENHDEISFVIGNENQAAEINFHRPIEIKDIEQIFADNRPQNSLKSNESIDGSILNSSKSYVKVLKLLGIFVIFVIFSVAIIFGVKLWYYRKISRSGTAKKSVSIRFFYSLVRLCLLLITLIIGIIIWIILLIQGVVINQYIGIVIFFGGGGLLLSIIAKLSLPINFMTIDRFMRKERSYILYLRSFTTDNYTAELEGLADNVSKFRPWATQTVDTDKIDGNPNLFPLNEKSLAKAWKRYIQVYSVGHPTELESPQGSRRIYLDNDTWKEDAFNLMRLAKYIIVCVHPSENCIWEIMQCNLHFSDKTIYYIDDIESLNIVRGIMKNNLPECLESDQICQNHMVTYTKNNTIVVDAYANNYLGQKKIVANFFDI